MDIFKATCINHTKANSSMKTLATDSARCSLSLSRNDAVVLGSAPASGAVGCALAAHTAHANPVTVGYVHSCRCSARGRAEQQPRRLRSPFISTASFQLRERV